MPIFDFKCETCEKITEHWCKAENKEMPCSCGGTAKKIITRATVHPDLEPYLDEHIASEPVWIKSRQHRKEMMQKHGVYEKVGKGWDTSFR